MKKQILAIAAGSLALGCHAATKSEYVVIDSFEVMRSSDEGKRISQDIEAKEARYRTELENEQRKLGEEAQKLQAQRATLSPELVAKKETDLKRKQEDLQLKAQDYQRELQMSMQQASQEMYKNMQEAAEKMAKDCGYKMVLNKTGEILYAADDVNATASITKELNKKSTELAKNKTEPKKSAAAA